MTRVAALALALSLSGCMSLDPVPPTIDFGETFVGLGSVHEQVVWKNNSTDNHTWDVRDLVVTGPFHLQAKAVPARVRAGATTAPAWIRFVPQSEGPFAGTAIPYSELGFAGMDLRLRGTGVVPVLPESGYLGPVKPASAVNATESSMDFGEIPVGTRAYRTLTLRNPGGSDQALELRFNPVLPQYTAAATATATSTIRSVTVPAGSSVTIVLVFAPTSPGDHPDQLTVGGAPGKAFAHIRLRLTGKARPG